MYCSNTSGSYGGFYFIQRCKTSDKAPAHEPPPVAEREGRGLSCCASRLRQGASWGWGVTRHPQQLLLAGRGKIPGRGAAIGWGRALRVLPLALVRGRRSAVVYKWRRRRRRRHS